MAQNIQVKPIRIYFKQTTKQWNLKQIHGANEIPYEGGYCILKIHVDPFNQYRIIQHWSGKSEEGCWVWYYRIPIMNSPVTNDECSLPLVLPCVLQLPNIQQQIPIISNFYNCKQPQASTPSCPGKFDWSITVKASTLIMRSFGLWGGGGARGLASLGGLDMRMFCTSVVDDRTRHRMLSVRSIGKIECIKTISINYTWCHKERC